MDTKKLRQIILDLAIRGKLVPQDPNDEPASILIEKIRAEKERLIKEKKIKRDKNESHIYRSDKSYYEKFAGGTVKCIDEEIAFDIPESWGWEFVGNLSPSLQYGTSEKSLPEGKIAVLRMGNILPLGELSYDDLVFTSNEEDIVKYALAPGDLLFNRTNSSEWVGKTAIYRGNIPSIYAGYIIRFRPILLNLEYVNYIMNSGHEKDYCQSVKTDGVNQSNINAQKLANFLIPIPPLEEQARIVSEIQLLFSFIDSLDVDKISLEQLINQAKSKVLDLAIRGKLVPQDPNDEPASVLLERIKAEHPESKKKVPKTSDNSHYGNLDWKIPLSWSWCDLSDVCIFERGVTFPSSAKTTYKQENLLPCIRTANVQEQLELDDLWYIDPAYIKNNKNKILRNGDIIMSSANSKELVGKTSYVQEIESNMTFGGFVLNIRAIEINSKYLFYLLRCYFEKGVFMIASTQTTNIANINAASLGSLKIPLPPLNEQIRIALQIDYLFQKTNMIIAEL